MNYGMDSIQAYWLFLQPIHPNSPFKINLWVVLWPVISQFEIIEFMRRRIFYGTTSYICLFICFSITINKVEFIFNTAIKYFCEGIKNLVFPQKNEKGVNNRQWYSFSKVWISYSNKSTSVGNESTWYMISTQWELI